MSKYYENKTTARDFKKLLTSAGKYASYFYYDAYYQLLNTLTISQIFEPYRCFETQSVNTWFSKIKLKNKDIDSEQIELIFNNIGVSL